MCQINFLITLTPMTEHGVKYSRKCEATKGTEYLKREAQVL